MTEIFKFKEQQVRVIGSADNLWWVAADICAVLEISNVSQKLQSLDEDERSMFNIGRQGEAWAVNESGLYSLILSSRKPQAREFKKWITSEVLPAIRKTGSYSLTNQNPNSRLAEDLMLADYAARSAQNAGVDKKITEQIKLEALIKMYPEREKLLKPQKEAIAASNPLPEKPMTATEVGQQLGLRLGYPKISAKKVNSKLLQLGYQVSVTRVKRSTGKEVHDYYQPTEKGKPHSTLLLSLYVEGEGKATKAQLRWFESIISILAHNWEDSN